MHTGEKLGRAIEEARKKAGISKAELARQFKVTPQSVQGWVKTGRVSKDTLIALMDFFQNDVPPAHWGLRGDSYQYLDVAKALAPPSNKALDAQANTLPGPDVRGSVPLISWVQAGEWAEIVDTFQPGEADEWRETTANVGPHAFALRVQGDSMTSPAGISIPEGSVVIIDPDADYHNGSIVVAKLVDTQEATLKKLVIDGPNKYLKPLNPSYAPIPINGNCRIIGVAKKVEFDL